MILVKSIKVVKKELLKIFSSMMHFFSKELSCVCLKGQCRNRNCDGKANRKRKRVFKRDLKSPP